MSKKALFLYRDSAVASIAIATAIFSRIDFCCRHGSTRLGSTRPNANLGADTSARLRVRQHGARRGDGQLPVRAILGISAAGKGETLRGECESAQSPVRIVHGRRNALRAARGRS